MKKTTLFLLSVLTAATLYAQDISGQWNGVLNVQGTQLRLVFHIDKTATGYSATMDSPDQGAAGIPATSTTFENANLKIEIANVRIEYTGELKENNVVGTFKQAGQSFPMDLLREEIAKKAVFRPQEPVKPYPYYSEDVKFENKKDHVTLAGTLSLPKKEGKFPVVLLITGSGPQNRDEELLGHKPFLVLSDYLTKNGIAVLRYDDRGTAGSTGDFNTATSLDFASDVEAAVPYLKTRKEIFDLVKKSSDTDKLKTDLTNYIKQILKSVPEAQKQQNMPEDAFVKLQVDQLSSPWMQYFIKYDPAIILEKVKCPVLAVNGEKDLQVPPKVNLESIKTGLKKGGNKKVTIKEFPNLNHLFQECKTGAPDEYAEIEQTFSPVALEDITKWVLGQVKNK